MDTSFWQLRTDRTSLPVTLIVLLADELVWLLFGDASVLSFLLGRVDRLVGIDCLIRIIGVAPLLPGVIGVHLVGLPCCIGFYAAAAVTSVTVDHSASCITLRTLFEDCDVRNTLLPVFVD